MSLSSPPPPPPVLGRFGGPLEAPLQGDQHTKILASTEVVCLPKTSPDFSTENHISSSPEYTSPPAAGDISMDSPLQERSIHTKISSNGPGNRPESAFQSLPPLFKATQTLQTQIPAASGGVFSHALHFPKRLEETIPMPQVSFQSESGSGRNFRSTISVAEYILASSSPANYSGVGAFFFNSSPPNTPCGMGNTIVQSISENVARIENAQFQFGSQISPTFSAQLPIFRTGSQPTATGSEISMSSPAHASAPAGHWPVNPTASQSQRARVNSSVLHPTPRPATTPDKGKEALDVGVNKGKHDKGNHALDVGLRLVDKGKEALVKGKHVLAMAKGKRLLLGNANAGGCADVKTELAIVFAIFKPITSD